MTRHTPDEIITTIDDILTGKDDHGTDIWSCIWEIIEDILYSIELAEDSIRYLSRESPDYQSVHTTITDYVTNHYGLG